MRERSKVSGGGTGTAACPGWMGPAHKPPCTPSFFPSAKNKKNHNCAMFTKAYRQTHSTTGEVKNLESSKCVTTAGRHEDNLAQVRLKGRKTYNNWLQQLTSKKKQKKKKKDTLCTKQKPSCGRHVAVPLFTFHLSSTCPCCRLVAMRENGESERHAGTRGHTRATTDSLAMPAHNHITQL